MSRLPPLTLDAMSDAQRRIHDDTVAGPRGRMPAPLAVWLRSPQLADRAQRLGEFLRYQTTLPPRLSELAILVTARFWTAHYEWAAHEKEALKAGVSPAVVESIARREPPLFGQRDEQAVWNFVGDLHHAHRVSDAVYAEAIAALGEQGVVELVGIVCYYTLVAMTLNVFQIGEAAGALRLPE